MKSKYTYNYKQKTVSSLYLHIMAQEEGTEGQCCNSLEGEKKERKKKKRKKVS